MFDDFKNLEFSQCKYSIPPAGGFGAVASEYGGGLVSSGGPAAAELLMMIGLSILQYCKILN